MTQKKQAQHVLDAWQGSRLAVFANVSVIMVLTMAILGGGGYALDMQLGSSPLLFVIGLVLAFPLAQFFVYKKVKKISKDKLNSTK